ncbi:protein-L-isoaspartate O-methyltransferase [Streptomyces sp. NPDC050485]|uniref:protein-L-isoaspartate O-methyltransferase n=1 Tax=Streptomyces sp. NPDC050485 TaxID=3365617 RepID=UPI00379E7582
MTVLLTGTVDPTYTGEITATSKIDTGKVVNTSPDKTAKVPTKVEPAQVDIDYTQSGPNQQSWPPEWKGYVWTYNFKLKATKNRICEWTLRFDVTSPGGKFNTGGNPDHWYTVVDDGADSGGGHATKAALAQARERLFPALVELVGSAGTVTSLDIDRYLTVWANLIHHERGLDNIRCFTADGIAGFPERAPYDRMVAWCTPPLLPKPWVDQVVDGALIVAPLSIAAVPNMTVVAKVRVSGGQPTVEAVFNGGYIEATASPKTDLDLPGRWVDWENRVPAPSWISIAWRERDDWRHTGARTALNVLLKDTHTEPYPGETVDWPSWRTYAAATGDPHLTMAGLSPDLWAIGHSTLTTAAVLQQDGTIIADAPDSPSLTVLRGWLSGWEKAGRPAPETYTPALVRYDDDQGASG